MRCEYCGADQPVEEMRGNVHGDLVCKDSDACDEREAQVYRDHLADLRRRQREGDELTESEKHELADAR